MRLALELAKRDAPVPFFGWRFVFPSPLLFGDFVVELLSKEVDGASCAVPAFSPQQNAERFRQVGFLDGCFHRKGVHVGYGESEDKLANYFVSREGVPWYVDIEPLGDATIIARALFKPFPLARRIQLLSDAIQSIGHLMRERELRAYCEGYAEGYSNGLKALSHSRMAEKLYGVLKREKEKFEGKFYL